MRWLPSDNIDLTLGVTQIAQDGYGTALAPNTAPSPLTMSLGGRRQLRGFTAEVDGPIAFPIDNTVYTGELKWNLGALDLKMIGSDQRVRNHGDTDFDGTNAPIITFSADIYSDVQTGELQLLSNKDSWGASWLESIGGVYYFRSTAGLKPRLTLFGGNSGNVQVGALPAVPLGQLVAALPQALRDALGPVPLTQGVVARLSGEVQTESSAVFAQSTAHITDWLALTLARAIRRSGAKRPIRRSQRKTPTAACPPGSTS